MKIEALIAKSRAAKSDADAWAALTQMTDRLEAIAKLWRGMESDGWVIDPWDSAQFSALRKVMDGETA